MIDQAPAPTTRGNPAGLFRDHPMDWLRTEIDHLFENFGRPAAGIFNFGNRSSAAALPAVELVDDEKTYRLTAELPGLNEQDIAVSVTDGVLSISGERKEAADRKDKGYVYSERRYGSFHRQMVLPSDVDQDGITADFKDGILTVTLAKDEKVLARSRKIEIGKA